MKLSDIIAHLENLKSQYGDVPFYQSTPDSMSGHDAEFLITKYYIGFISKDNPIRFSGDLDPQVDRVTIFRYPRFVDQRSK